MVKNRKIEDEFEVVVENGITIHRKKNYDKILEEDLKRQSLISIEELPVPSPEDDMNWIRMERNKKLEETDWTQLPDVPELTRLKWQEYRQALRDVTSNCTSMLDVVWPNKPEK
jgi:hypothetical protein